MLPPLSSSGWRVAALLALALSVRPETTRAQAIGQGFELERQGRIEQAATLYLNLLRGDPANLSALLGLERVLPQLNRLAELLPAVQRARAVDSGSPDLRALELRAYGLLNEPDSLAVVARQWIAVAPTAQAPWREWAVALEDLHRFDDARAVLMEGRRALGTQAAFAIELAELLQRVGEWPSAAAEWAAVVSAATEQIPNAASQLDDTPTDQRERVLRVLTGRTSQNGGSTHPQWLAAELLLGWGRPEQAWDLIAATVGSAGDTTKLDGGREVISELRRFAERAAQGTTPAHRRVNGLALARYADFVPPPMSTRARAEAARALISAGDGEAARAVLTQLAGDPAAPSDVQLLAQAALIEALLREGQLDSAERRLKRPAAGTALSGDDRERLTLELARAWIASGKLDRAEQAIGGDSSIEALAAKGLVLLYRGELKAASTAFRAAGPYAGDRAAATERTAWLALLQGIAAERDVELGQALLLLARGDSSRAVGALRSAAVSLPVRGGRYDVLLLAGQVAAQLGGTHDADAAAVFEEIVNANGGSAESAAPPAAELAWGRLLARQGRAPEAMTHLEHLILTYPHSAIVPEARRELERLRGAIPRS